jgi:hypothetical protein
VSDLPAPMGPAAPRPAARPLRNKPQHHPTPPQPGAVVLGVFFVARLGWRAVPCLAEVATPCRAVSDPADRCEQAARHPEAEGARALPPEPVSQNGELLSRRGRSLPANASTFDSHRDSITSRVDRRPSTAFKTREAMKEEEMLKETGNINKSLFTLGKVISALGRLLSRCACTCPGTATQ